MLRLFDVRERKIRNYILTLLSNFKLLATHAKALMKSKESLFSGGMCLLCQIIAVKTVTMLSTKPIQLLTPFSMKMNAGQLKPWCAKNYQVSLTPHQYTPHHPFLPPDQEKAVIISEYGHKNCCNERDGGNVIFLAQLGQPICFGV